MIKDYYSILDVSPNASDGEIKSAYRTKARKYHPDVNSSFDTTEMMQLINEAYLILNDLQKRSAYDREYSIYTDWKAKRPEPAARAQPTPESPPKEEFVDDDYSIHDEQLNDWMKEAADAAKEILKQVKSDTKGMAKAAGAEMVKYLVVGIILTVIGFLGLVAFNSRNSTRIYIKPASTDINEKQPIQTIPGNWDTVRIKDVCSFRLPPSMELQGDGYRKMMDTFQETICYIMEYAYDEKRVVAQPKGINKLDKNALNHYSRFIVETFPSQPSEPLPKLSDALDFTKQELDEMNVGFRQEQMADIAMANSKGIPMKILEWYPLKVSKLQNADALEYGFLRKSGVEGKAPVNVKYYLLFNRTIAHKITVSFRTDETELWDNALKKMLSSLKFNEM